MSTRHPIVAITGSSGAGTTSVMRTFAEIFRREGVTAAYVEGDSFHRYDRLQMRQRMAEELEKGNQHFSHFSPDSNLFEELEALFREYGTSGNGQVPQVPARRGRGGAVLAAAGDLHGLGRPAGRHRPPVLRGAARRRRHRQGERGAPRGPADRRGAGDQPGVDPETAPGQERPRLQHGGGDGHDPPAHAGLRAVHRAPVLADPRELPARADRGHVEPLHLPHHTDGGRVDAGDPLRQSARDRLRLPAARC